MPNKISETEHGIDEQNEPSDIVKAYKNLKVEKTEKKNFDVKFSAYQIQYQPFGLDLKKN